MLLASRSRRLGKVILRGAGLFTLLLAICIPATGCSSSTASGTFTQTGGTPAGAYTYNVTTTSGATSHVETITLNVN